ncbi:MAG: cobalt-precorrin-6A reductase [Peptococcaceae bacterium]
MILLLGGTRESREIAKLLQQEKIKHIISTVSDYGGQLAEEISENVHREVLEYDRLLEFCRQQNITTIIDATHPFAKNISLNAIKTAGVLAIKYLRFERKTMTYPDNPLIRIVSDMDEAAAQAENLGKKILLTIGSKQLTFFQKLITRKEVYVRILPDLDSLHRCFSLGLQPQQIIAMQGPFSKEFNQLLIKEKQIEVVVSKESGQIGGLDAKLTACLELNIPLIVITKPQIPYPRIVYEYEKVLQEVSDEL